MLQLRGFILLGACTIPPVYQFSMSNQANYHHLSSMSNDNEMDPPFFAREYEYVDDKIAEALQSISTHEFSYKLVHESKLCIDWKNLDMLLSEHYAQELKMKTLVTLAIASENAMFLDANVSTKTWPDFIISLFNNINNYNAANIKYAHITIGTQLLIGILESDIRNVFAKKAGHAPLLKDMIQNLGTIEHSEYNSLAHILKILLLPSGINLRNLLWHGFLPTLSRQWFALCAVLIISIRELRNEEEIHISQEQKYENAKSIEDMSKHQATQFIMEHGSMLRCAENISKLEDYAKSFIPASHHNILHVALNHYINHDACLIAILSPLLEHSLRLLWCECNDRRHDRQAHPGQYYVTLDGHGQRNKHDLILHPYVYQNGVQRNDLIQKLGTGVTLLLMDLFVSPHGPNIRATITHGIWDTHIISELKDKKQHIISSSPSPLECITQLLLSLLHILSEKSYGKTTPSSFPSFSFPLKHVANYQPLFSFTSYTFRNMELLLKKLYDLSDFISSEEIMYKRNQDLLCRDYDELNSVKSLIPEIKQKFFGDVFSGDTWTIETLYHEYDMNVKLANCGAERSLIEDIACGASSYTLAIMKKHKQNLTGELNSRQVKRFLNLCSISVVAYDLYSFTLYVALSSILQKMNDSDSNKMNCDTCIPSFNLLKSVERSRMVVSTFSTFNTVNINRALKAVDNYVSSKHVKMILKHVQKANNSSS